MPIAVTCPGCKASFNVSEKFAGKQGPCPKCKTVINIPKADAAKKQEEVKIHAPEEAQVGAGGKTATGRPVFKPIERVEVKLNPVAAVSIGVGIIALFVSALLFGDLVKAPFPLSPEEQRMPDIAAAYSRALMWDYIIRGVILAVVGAPIVWAGYLILRDDELEPYRGNALWLRCGVCLAIYLGLWGGYALLPFDYTSAGYSWLILAPPILIIGTLTAYFCFELEPVAAATHFLFFAIVTLMLGWSAGLTMPWHSEARTLFPAKIERPEELPIYDSAGRPMNDAAIELERAKATGSGAGGS